MAQYNFLDEYGILTLAKELYKRLNMKISSIIVNDINASSDDKHVVSAKKIYEIYEELKLTSGNGSVPAETAAKISKLISDLGNLTTKVDGIKSFETVIAVAPLADIPNPKSSTLYFHKDREDDEVWNISVYEEYKGTTQWITMGSTPPDLSNYWSKSDLSNMKTALGLPVDLSGVWKKSETTELKTQLSLPDFSTFYRKNEIANMKTDLGLPDFTTFWKKDEIEALKTALDLDSVKGLTIEEVKTVIRKALEEAQSGSGSGASPTANQEKINKLEAAMKLVEEKIKTLTDNPIDAYTKQETDEKLKNKLDSNFLNFEFRGKEVIGKVIYIDTENAPYLILYEKE